MSRAPGYTADRTGTAKVTVPLTPEVIRQIDEWGVPAGMASRTSAIRALLIRGLEATRGDGNRAAESASQVLPS